MVTPQHSGKEAYEAAKAEREKARSAESASSTRAHWIKYMPTIIIIAVILAGLSVYAWRSIEKQIPQNEDRSVFYPGQGQEHIEVGSEHPAYSSNPPTSGWHYAVPAKTGFRTEHIVDEHIVHSLEHGVVWISYQPDVPQEIRDQLKDLAGGYVIVTEREKNDKDIAVAAWTRLDTFDLENGSLDITRIRDFINRYRDKGPERLPPGSHGQGI